MQNRCPWTEEDAAIVLRTTTSADRFKVLGGMLLDDQDDAIRMYDRVVGRIIDEQYEYYLEEQMQQWMAEEADAEERAAAEAATEHLY